MSTTPRVLVLQERGGHHIDFSRRARTWLNSFGARYELDFDYIEDTNAVDEVFLARYAMILQLDFPPYGWSEVAAAPGPGPYTAAGLTMTSSIPVSAAAASASSSARCFERS